MKFQGTYGTDFSGSLGGTTAAKNKGGQYLKSKPIPTNPNTIAQIEARAKFNAAASGWSAVSPTELALWNNFAKTLYIPKSNPNSGQYSGFQAYTALNNQMFNAIGLDRTYILQVNNADPATANTAGIWIPPTNNPPIYNIVPQMRDKNGEENAMIPITGLVKVNGHIEFEWQVGGGGAIDIDAIEFPDESQMGFAIFMSNGNPQRGRSYQNPLRYNLGYFSSPLLGDPLDYASTQSLRIKSTDTLDISKYNTFPQVTQWVVLSLYVVGQSGNMSKVGVVEVQMQNA